MQLAILSFFLLPLLALAKLELGGADICLNGCCGLNLEVRSADLASSDFSAKLPVGKASIPCCNCTDSAPTVGSTFGVDQTLANIGVMPQKPIVNILGHKAAQE